LPGATRGLNDAGDDSAQSSADRLAARYARYQQVKSVGSINGGKGDRVLRYREDSTEARKVLEDTYDEPASSD
jgi:hypothetical protein